MKKRKSKSMSNVVPILKNSNKAPLLDGKVCSACGFEKPATAEYFSITKSGEPHSYCRSCNVEYQREYRRRIKNREPQVSEIQKEERQVREEKACTKCEEIKPLRKFYKNPGATDGHMSWCGACFRVWQRENRRSKDWALRLAEHTARRHLKYSDKPTDITAEFLRGMYSDQAGRCGWFFVELTLGVDSGPTQVTLDRIDNNRGYTQDNVHLACHAANLARNKYTFEEFEKFLDLVREEI